MRPLAALLLALALAACDGSALVDESGALVENAFTVRVDGGEPVTRRGAVFGAYETERGGTFAVLLGSDPGTQARAMTQPATGFLRDGLTPGPGTYALAPSGLEGDAIPDAFSGFHVDPALFVSGESPVQSGLFYARSGTLTVESIDGERMRGSFEMRAVELDEALRPVGDAVTVRGSFHAVRSEAFGMAGGLLG